MRHNLGLALHFALRDLRERYVGTSLGHLWYLLSPLILIFIYTVIFSDFVKMKLPDIESGYGYSIYLVPGILAWNTFATLLSRLNTSIPDRGHLIKKISVPIYSFQLAITITEFVLFCISMSLGLIFLLLIGHPVGVSFLWLLPVMGLQMLFTFAIGVILSLFMPFFRDLGEAVPIILQLWFWMTPIVYTPDMIADRYPWILTVNPFYPFVKIYHDIFVSSKSPEAGELLLPLAGTLVLLSLAGWLYKKMVPTIKDII